MVSRVNVTGGFDEMVDPPPIVAAPTTPIVAPPPPQAADAIGAPPAVAVAPVVSDLDLPEPGAPAYTYGTGEATAAPTVDSTAAIRAEGDSIVRIVTVGGHELFVNEDEIDVDWVILQAAGFVQLGPGLLINPANIASIAKR